MTKATEKIKATHSEKTKEILAEKEISSQELFMQKIVNIQYNLKAPKGQTNAFGQYKYRSCEDIMESVKPLLSEHNLVLKVSDEIELIGDRYYVKATASICDSENQIYATAFAREPIVKKGMDEAQITGATSSYARKYALNGLLCIDDTKDADSMDNTKNVASKPVSVQTKPIEGAVVKPEPTVEKPKEQSWHEKVTGLAKVHFKTPDEFKVWRVENDYAEDLKTANDFDLLRIHTGLKGMGETNG